VEYRPEYYAVLEAIARGIDTAEKISERVGLERGDVERVLRHLEISGLVARVRKGLVLKKEAYALTPTGWRRLDEWRERAKADLEKAAILKSRGGDDEATAMEVLTPYMAVLPFLLTLDHLAALGAYGLLGPEDEGVEYYEGLEEDSWGDLGDVGGDVEA